MTRAFALLLFVGTAAFAAQPDKTELLAKAKAKFEQEVGKAEVALLASIDKAAEKATKAGNKALADKLAYERELFTTQKLFPTAVPAAAYAKQVTTSTAALEAAYLPVIRDFIKAKKEDETEALENTLSALLKGARGYGIGLPNLAARPMVLIENKETGLVLEAGGKDGTGDATLAAKVGKRKPLQCWYLDRYEHGLTLVNAQTGRACFVDIRDGGVGGEAATVLASNKIDPTKEVPDRFYFRFAESRRETVITVFSKGDRNGYVLTAMERKKKGVAAQDAVLLPPGDDPKPAQKWLVTEAK